MSSIDLQTVWNAVPGNHVIIAPDAPTFTIIGATDSFLKTAFHTRESIIGRPLFEVFPDDPANQQATGVLYLRRSLEHVILHKEAHRMADQQYDIINPTTGNFESKVWAATNTPVLAADGQLQYILHTTEDITEKAQLRKENVEKEARLSESERRFRNLMQGVSAAIIVLTGPEMTVEIVNEAYGRLIERTPDELLGKPIFSLVPETEAFYLPILEKVRTTGESVTLYETPYTTKKDGKIIEGFLHVVNQPYRDTEGRIIGVIEILQDVTELVKAKKALEQREQHLNLLSNTVPAMIFYLDAAQRYQSYNETFMRWFGVNSREAIGKTVKEFIGEDAYVQVEPHLAVAYAGNQERYEMPAPARLGKNRWIDIVYTPHKNEDGTVVGVIVLATDITQSKQAEIALRESEDRFRLMADAIPEIIWVTDAQGQTDYFNKRWEEFSGVPYEPSNAAAVAARFIHPDDAPVVMQAFGEAIKYGRPLEVEQRNRAASGEWRWFLNRATPYHNTQTGEIEKWFGISTDIHERKQVQQALTESEARFRFAMNAGQLGSWELDLATFTLHASDLCKTIFGQPLDKPFTYEALHHTIHPADRNRMKEAVEMTIAGERDYDIEYRIIRPNGALAWVNIRGQVHHNSEGVPVSIIGISVDITQRKIAEQDLAESEEKLRSMVMQSQTGICILSGTPLRAEIVNDAFLAISGKSRQAFATQPYWEVLKEAEPFYAAILDEVFSTGRRYSVTNERIVLLRNGREEAGYFDFIFEPLKDANGHTTKVTLFVVEATEQVVARRKLEEKEKALEAALDQVQLSKEAAELGTFDMDLINGTMHWDERCRVLFGITHNKPVTYEQDFVGGLHPDDRERITKLIDNLFIKSVSEGNYDVEYRTIGQKDGVERWVRAKGKVYFNSEDKPVRFIGSVLDITPQMTALQKIEKTVEERTKELAQANETLIRINTELQRSNANLEEFAHAASHDLKEPVRKIRFFTHQLKEQLYAHLNEAELRSFLRIENASQRMGNLIDDLLLYSHVSQRPHEKEVIDLNTKMQAVLEDLELDIAEKQAVVHVEQLPIVKGYSRQLQQMFQNLISNALKYSKADFPPYINITASEVTKNGQHFHLFAVKDNGIGFKQEYADRIFQMFARLHGKSEYSGTGVGLSIVKKVVENHNGFVQVESVPDEGSVFKIYLPV